MIAISTTVNFEAAGSLAGALAELRKLGWTAVELAADGPVPDSVQAGGLVRDFGLRAPVVRAPLGPTAWREGNPARDLASTDEGRRTRAVRAVLASLPAAAAAGAEVIVTGMGRVEVPDAAARQARWRAALARGDDVPADEVRTALAERRARRDAHLEAAARSLFDLTRAEPGVTFAIANGPGFHEIPDLEEVEFLLSDAGSRRVDHFHDAGAAHVAGRLGISDPLAWFDRHGARTVGVAFSDVAGDADHLPPGTGELDFRALAGAVGASMMRVLRIGPGPGVAALRTAVDHLASRGIS